MATQTVYPTRSAKKTNQKKASAFTKQATATQRAKNDALINQLHEWMADESGYDEENWPKIKKAIEENRPSYRKRFSD